MKKYYSIIIALSLSLFFNIQEAKADFEVIQKVLMAAGNFMDKANSVIKDVQTQVKNLTREVNGVYGAYKDVKKEYDQTKADIDNAKNQIDNVKNQVADAKNQVSGIASKVTGGFDSAKDLVKNHNFTEAGLSRLNSQVSTLELPAFLVDVKDKSDGTIDIGKLEAQVAENYKPVIGLGDDSAVVQNKRAELNSIQSEAVANLLAESYNLLYRLDQEQHISEQEASAEASTGADSDNREMVQKRLTADMKSVARQNRINSIKSAIYTIEFQEKTATIKQFKSSAE